MALTVKVVTPSRIVFEDTADSVTVPGWEGQYTVLPAHASMLTLSRVGILKIKSGGSIQKFVIDKGFIEVGPTEMSVMVQHCINIEEIDKDQAELDYENAYATFRSLKIKDPTYENARKKMEYAKAIARA